MCIPFKDLIFKFFLKRIYKQNLGYYFPIFSKAPKYLNFAYPDFSIQYFIMSLPANKTIYLEGTIPYEKIYFWSCVLYGTDGTPYFHITDKNVPKNYSFKITTNQISSLIIRFYAKDENDDFYSFLPKIKPEFQTLSVNSRTQKTKKYSKLLENIISKRYNNISQELLDRHEFFLPGTKRRGNLFVNPNAIYLCSFTPKKSSIAKITLTVPHNSIYRYIGFMVSNYTTTATDASIHVSKYKKITLWICQKKNQDKLDKYGFNKNKDLTLFWKNSNKYPIIVYRLVMSNKKGIMKLNHKENDTLYPELKKFKETPTIQYY